MATINPLPTDISAPCSRPVGRSRQTTFFLQGMRSLQSGNLLPEARICAALWRALRDDRDTLVFLIQLCRAAGDLNEAERYARRLLKMSLWQELQRALALQQALPADTDHWQTVTATGSLAPFGRRGLPPWL